MTARYVAGTRRSRVVKVEPDYATLPPEEKVRIIAAMGFVRMGSDHQSDCAYQISSGYRCNCVPPEDTYSMPPDVAKHLGQDWESRRKAAKEPRPIPAVERW